MNLFIPLPDLPVTARPFEHNGAQAYILSCSYDGANTPPDQLKTDIYAPTE